MQYCLDVEVELDTTKKKQGGNLKSQTSKRSLKQI